MTVGPLTRNRTTSSFARIKLFIVCLGIFGKKTGEKGPDLGAPKSQPTRFLNMRKDIFFNLKKLICMFHQLML